MASGGLLAFLREDGRKLVDTGENVLSACFSSACNTGNTLSVSPTKGIYSCSVCGLSGNTLTYLSEIRGLKEKEVVPVLLAHGWNEAQINSLEQHQHQTSNTLEMLDDIPQRLFSRSLLCKYEYKNDDGETIFVKALYTDHNPSTPSIKSELFTKSPSGHWWTLAPDSPKIDDIQAKKLPIYNLASLRVDTDQQVWLMCSEQDVEAVKRLRRGVTPFAKASVSLYRNNLKISDLTPLRGRKIILIAPTDNKLRSQILKIGAALQSEQGCPCRYALLSGGTQSMQFLVRHYKEDFVAVQNFLRELPVQDYSQAYAKYMKTTYVVAGFLTDKADAFVNNEHFTILGIRAGGRDILIQEKNGWNILHMSAPNLSNINQLITLAPLKFWYSFFGSSNPSSYKLREVADQIFQQAKRKGMVEPVLKIFGRGAIFTDNVYYWNIGTGVLADAGDGLLTQLKGFSELSPTLFDAGADIPISSHPKAGKYCKDFVKAISKFRFLNESSMQAFVGWIVTALVGGAIGFRPVLWLQAPKDSGKTYLEETVLMPIFGTLAYRLTDTTESALATIAGNTSLPVIIDEMEPACSQTEAARKKRILSFIKASTSGDGVRMRSLLGNRVNYSRPRSSVLLSSINLPTIDDAIASRVYLSKLNNIPSTDWPDTEKMLLACLTPAKCMIMRSYIIQNTKRIANRIIKSERTLIKCGMRSRDAKIISALKAGFSFMSGTPANSINKDGVLYSDEATGIRLLKDILNYNITYKGTQIKSIYQLLLDYPSDQMAQDKLLEVGIKISRTRTSLVIAHGSLPKSILDQYPTPRKHLLELEGTTVMKRKFDGVFKPCLKVPVSFCENIGYKIGED